MTLSKSYEVQLINGLTKLLKSLPNPDADDNAGRLLGEVFAWDVIKHVATAKSTQLWNAMEDEEHINTANLAPGEHELTTSPHFITTAKVTEPVTSFDPQGVIDGLRDSKYRVPDHVTKELINASRKEGKCRVTKRVIERVSHTNG